MSASKTSALFAVLTLLGLTVFTLTREPQLGHKPKAVTIVPKIPGQSRLGAPAGGLGPRADETPVSAHQPSAAPPASAVASGAKSSRTTEQVITGQELDKLEPADRAAIERLLQERAQSRGIKVSDEFLRDSNLIRHIVRTHGPQAERPVPEGIAAAEGQNAPASENPYEKLEAEGLKAQAAGALPSSHEDFDPDNPYHQLAVQHQQSGSGN